MCELENWRPFIADSGLLKAKAAAAAAAAAGSFSESRSVQRLKKLFNVKAVKLKCSVVKVRESSNLCPPPVR